MSRVTPRTSASVALPSVCGTFVGVQWDHRRLGFLRHPAASAVICSQPLELVPHKRTVRCSGGKNAHLTAAVARPPTTLWTLTAKRKDRAQAWAVRRFIGTAA